MGFCYKMLYNCSWWFNLINLVICEKLKILGLEYTQIVDFVQLGLNWRNWLVELIHMIISLCYLYCLMINWSIFKIKKKKLNKWFFKFWGFCYNLYAQANFVILKLIELSLTALGHVSFDYTVHASYRLLFSILFCANLQFALGFSCFLFGSFLCVLSFP